MTMIDFEKMKKKSENRGVILTDDQLRLLDVYSELLVDWNSRINLTSITDSDGIMTKHFEDCISVLQYINLPLNSKIIDVGSGAGFPGLVLKIVRPDLNLTLLDSLNKRIVFLNAVSKELGLTVETVHLRAEDGGKSLSFREKFDFAFARAVSNLRSLSELCLPYVKIGGQFISMKGPESESEVDASKSAIHILGGIVSDSFYYSLSDGSGRSLIVVNKIKPTPSKYPRISAKIKNNPL